jgi:hypothetical protein
MDIYKTVLWVCRLDIDISICILFLHILHCIQRTTTAHLESKKNTCSHLQPLAATRVATSSRKWHTVMWELQRKEWSTVISQL